MKKKIAVLTLLAALNACALSGCGTDKADTASTTQEASTQATDTQATTAADTQDTEASTAAGTEETTEASQAESSIDVYKDVLDKYRTAVTEKWDYGTCMEQDICPLITNTNTSVASFDNIGAALIDMDHDGYDELIIGDPTDTSGKSVYEVWTYDGTTPTKLIAAQDRNLLNVGYMEEDNVYFISAMGSNSAAEFEYDYYTVTDGALQNIQSIISEAASETEINWYQAAPASGTRESLDADTANGIVDSYNNACILPEYRSIEPI